VKKKINNNLGNRTQPHPAAFQQKNHKPGGEIPMRWQSESDSVHFIPFKYNCNFYGYKFKWEKNIIAPEAARWKSLSQT